MTGGHIVRAKGRPESQATVRDGSHSVFRRGRGRRCVSALPSRIHLADVHATIIGATQVHSLAGGPPPSASDAGCATPAIGRAGTAPVPASRSTVFAGSLPGAQAISASNAKGTHAIRHSRLISVISFFLLTCALGAEDPLGAMKEAMR